MDNQSPFRSDDLTKMVVVEAANYCRCHVVVTCRRVECPSYLFFYVQSPLDINFGDTVLVAFSYDKRNHPTEIKAAYLCRGPNLIYELILDTFPPEILQHIIMERHGGREDDMNVDLPS